MIELRGAHQVAAGQSLTASGGSTGFRLVAGLSDPVLQVTNAGLIAFSSDASGAIYAIDSRVSLSKTGSLFHNLEGGVIRFEATHSQATLYGFWGGLGGGPIPFTNDGLFEVISAGSAIGLMPYATHGPIINTGVINVQAAAIAVGVNRFQGGSLANTGLIDVTAGQRAEGVVIGGHNYSFRNDGEIIARSTNSYSIGISILADGLTENFGRIEADFAIVSDRSTPFMESQDDRLNNRGTIVGEVHLLWGNDQLFNTGTIDGVVDLGQGDDIFDGSAGVQDEAVFGGADDDRLIGGAGHDHLFGEIGDDLLQGGSGDDVLDGGRGNDRLEGGAGSDIASFSTLNTSVSVNLGTGVAVSSVGASTLTGIEQVLGSRFGDTLIAGAAAAVLMGGGGDDQLTGGQGGDTLVGGLGADRLSGGGGADLFVFDLDGSSDLIVDFENGQDRIQVMGASAALSMVQDGADIVLTFAGGSSLRLAGEALATFDTSRLTFHGARWTPPDLGGVLPPREGSETILVHGHFLVGEDEIIRFDDPAHQFNLMGFLNDTMDWPAPFVENRGQIIFEFDEPGVYLDFIAVEHRYGYSGDYGPHHLPELATPSFHTTSTGSLQIDATSAGGYITVLDSPSWGGRVINDGVWNVHATDASITGVRSYTSDQIVENRGQITLTADSGGASGFHLENGGAFRNWGDVRIISGDSQARGVSSGEGYSELEIVNHGSLIVEGGSDRYPSAAIYTRTPDDVSVTNTGLIESSHSVLDAFYADVTLINSGTLLGDIWISNGTVQNTGRMEGQFRVGFAAVPRDFLFDGSGGTFIGDMSTYNANDTIFAGDGAASINASHGDDVVHGQGGDDLLDGWSGSDRLYGGEGDDVLTGSWNDDLLDGGEGEDTAVFSGLIKDYKIVREGDGFRVKGADGSDFVTGVEVLKFDDRSIELNLIVCDPVTGAVSIGDDAPLVLPGEFVSGSKDAPVSPWDEGDDPLILPPGTEAKFVGDDAPVVCPPNDMAGVGGPVDRPLLDLAELGLSTFDGRDPHRLTLQSASYDWIV